MCIRDRGGAASRSAGARAALRALRAGAGAGGIASGGGTSCVLPRDGGTDDAFLPLAAACFSAESSDGTSFQICPFHNATQNKGGRRLALVGSSWAWAERDARMVISGGDACPNHVRRRAELTFECGGVSAVLSVSEREMCSYSFRFGTPAACASS